MFSIWYRTFSTNKEIFSKQEVTVTIFKKIFLSLIFIISWVTHIVIFRERRRWTLFRRFRTWSRTTFMRFWSASTLALLTHAPTTASTARLLLALGAVWARFRWGIRAGSWFGLRFRTRSRQRSWLAPALATTSASTIRSRTTLGSWPWTGSK